MFRRKSSSQSEVRRNRSFEMMEDRQLMAADLAGAIDLADAPIAPFVEAGAPMQEAPVPGPVLPGPVLPGPVLPGPELPGPELPGPILPGPILPGPVLPPLVPVSEFTGTWTNVGPTGGITKIQITSDFNGEHTIEAWGACFPSDCEWGTTKLDLLGTSVTDQTPDYAIGRWDPGFKDTVLTIEDRDGYKVVDLFNMYKDGSGRQDFHSRYLLRDSGAMVQAHHTMDDSLADILVGGWVNEDVDARGITKLAMTETDSGLQAHGWGSCTPTDCDWGTTDMRTLGSSIADASPHYAAASYDHGHATQFITTRRAGSELVVNRYTVFQDGSDRSNYFSEDSMWKIGDANHDGHFNTSDLVQMMASGKYEDGIPGNATWEDGDWNRDGDVDSADLVEAFKCGGYESRGLVIPEIQVPDWLEELPPFEIPGGDPIGPVLEIPVDVHALDEVFGSIGG